MVFPGRTFFRSLQCLGVAAVLVLVPGVVSGQPTFEVVRSIAPEPGYPWGRILLGADGALYGTTYVGGPAAAGTIFRLELQPDGSAVHETMHTFGGTDGRFPVGDLIQAGNGKIYGTTCEGGAEEAGVAFELSTSGQYSVLHTFRPSLGEGDCPWAGLVEGPDGDLYGTTNGRALFEFGRRTIFRLAPDGTFATMHTFEIDDSGPYAALTRARDGHFYGSTSGTLFRITVEGIFETLHTFGSGLNEERHPYGALVEGPNGDLFGTTTSTFFFGDSGTAFKLTLDGQFTSLGPTPISPIGTLVLGSDGDFYGTASNAVPAVVYRMTPSGQVTVSNQLEGEVYAGLIQAPDGTFYGTITLRDSVGRGRVFRIAPSGDVEYIHTFEPPSGLVPIAGLTVGADGSFYGTTLRGGSHDSGTIFKIDPSGAWSTLFDFGATDTRSPGTVAKLFQGGDGSFYGVSSGRLFRMSPEGEVEIVASVSLGAPVNTGFVQGRDGRFYGTNQNFRDFGGAVLSVTEDGVVTVLHRFGPFFNPWDRGCASVAALVEGTDGNFYGSTFNCYLSGSGGGTIFRISPAGGHNILHAFTLFTFDDGLHPTGALIQGRDGNFYGTTRDGGLATPSAPDGLGTVFQITADGELTTLHRFVEQDGANPFAGLAEGEEGVFYGTTPSGGQGHGTVYRIDASGAFEVVHTFSGVDGSMPYAPLTEAPDGSLYGITPVGGTAGYGTVFRIASESAP